VSDYLAAVLLGAVQAVTEFLPVSSSGHLLLGAQLFDSDAGSLTFSIGLHVGSLVAVLLFFWRDWCEIALTSSRDMRQHRIALARWSAEGQVGLLLVVATVPAVVAGAAFGTSIEQQLRAPWLVAANLIGFGLILGVADKRPMHYIDVRQTRLRHAFIVGMAQALAVVPGVSRSGVTFSAGRGLGFDRTAATRLSFLMSAPVILAAASYEGRTVISGSGSLRLGPMLAGALVSTVLGILAMRWLMRYVESHSIQLFVWYRVGLGLLILSIYAFA